MRVKSNLPKDNWKNLRSDMTAQGTNSNVTSSFYRMDDPLRLSSISLNNSCEAEYFAMGAISPNFSFLTTLGRSEAEEHITKGLHQHEFYELLYVMQGTVYQNIENQRHLYPQGSFCLLNKNTRHTEEYSTDFKAYFLQISERFLKEVQRDLSYRFFEIEREEHQTNLEDFLQQNIGSAGQGKEFLDFIPTEDGEKCFFEVNTVFEKIGQILTAPRRGSSAELKYLCVQLFILLNDRTLYHTNPVSIGTETESLLYTEITRIMEATSGRATRGQLEEALHYSGTYLNRIVKKYTGPSIFDYGMTFCMKNAADLLTGTELSIADIAARLQFGNRSNFYKQFTSFYSMTPAQYREKHRKMAAQMSLEDA